MTADPVPSGLHPFSHLKAGPTTSSSRSIAVPASPTTASTTQLAHRSQHLKSTGRDEQLNGISDKATIALIRRVLCPQAGSYGGATSPSAPEELLPPLTSSNDVDRQLYALIAIIIKEFISSWYSKITPDQALINEVLQLVAHCTRALEQRLRGIDIAQLVLDDIPALVEAHIISYRLAKEQSKLSGLTPSSREIYHALNPHPGLSPVPDTSDSDRISQQRDNEAIYRRLLVSGVLAVLLPTEDLENASLRTLLNDIIADLILGNEVSDRVCEGWFLWESTTKLLDVLSRDSAGHEDDATRTEPTRPNRLHQYGLLSNMDSGSEEPSSTTQSQSLSWIWDILQYAFLGYVTLRFVVAGLFRNASTAPGVTSSRPSPLGSLVDDSELFTKPGDIRKRPVLDYRVFGMLSQLLGIPRRMPWLGGLLALVQYLLLAGPGSVGGSGSILDRFLRENIEQYVLTPTLLPNLLLASREALFPHNTRPNSKPGASVNRIEVLTSPPTSIPPTPGGAQPTPIKDTQTTTASGGNAITPTIIATATTAGSPPLSPDQQRRLSPAEIASIRRKCALGILSLVPRPIVRRVLGLPTQAGTGSGPRRNSTHPESPTQSPTSQVPESGPGTREIDHHPSDNEAKSASELSGIDGDADSEELFLVEAIESEILDLFADEYCNKHLVYSIIETVLTKLLAELSDRSITDLMEDRGVFIG
ncbi:PXA domain-containing protein [Aspergillus undulatus]|uniref:PXA domain-containing protein n=1 Tax=Aspergillus undulatus TaxID=1810928 RepID=UPI003CCE0A71